MTVFQNYYICLEYCDMSCYADSVESQWQELQRMYDELRHETDPSAIVKQVLYCSIALFMSCLVNYSGRIDPEQFAGKSQAFQRDSQTVTVTGHTCRLLDTTRATTL